MARDDRSQFRGLIHKGQPSRVDRAKKASRLAFARLWRLKHRPFFDALYGPELRNRLGEHQPNIGTRAAGLAFAARWRAEQPFKAMLDELYGAERA